MKFNFEFEANLSSLPNTGSRNIVELPGLVSVKQDAGKVLFNFPWRDGRYYYIPNGELISNWNLFKLTGDGNQVLLTVNNGTPKELANSSTAQVNKWCNGGSNSNYINITTQVPLSTANSWEIQCRFIHDADGTAYSTLFGTNSTSNGYYFPELRTTTVADSAGTAVMGLNVWQNSSTKIVNASDSTFHPEVGTEYFVRAGFTGTTYYLDYRDKNTETWTRAQEVTSSTKTYQSGSMCLMNNRYYSTYYFCGNFDLAHFYIKINGSMWFDGSLDEPYYIDAENAQLSENGTVGGNSNACEASSGTSKNAPWYAFNKTLRPTSTSNVWRPTAPTASVPQWITYYTPTANGLASFAVVNGYASRNIATGYMQGSIDNVNWTDLANFTNSSTDSGVVTTVNIPVEKQTNKYNYFRLTATTSQNASSMVLDELYLYYTDGTVVPITYTVNGTTITPEVIGVFYPTLNLGKLKAYQSWMNLRNIKAIKLEN